MGKKKPGRPPRACSLCLTEDAELAVPEGSRSIAEMEVGDRVLSDEPEAVGEWTRVAAGTPQAQSSDEGTYVYESRTGRWVPVQGAPPPGWRVLRDGQLEGRPVSLSALERADATWEESPRHGVPAPSDEVLVLGEGLHHAPLVEVEVGRQVAYEGRVFATLGLEQVSAVRPTGQVLARVVDTFARLAPEVLEATIGFEDGTTEVLTGTPEHPVHLAAEGRYAPLRELRPGDRLTTRDGTEAVLQQVERRYGDIEVFNVEVAGQHNYLAEGLLVHNPRRRCKRVGEFCQSIKDNWFRGPEWGRWKDGGQWQEGYHFHFDPFPGSSSMMGHHLPQQRRRWRKHFKSHVSKFCRGKKLR